MGLHMGQRGLIYLQMRLARGRDGLRAFHLLPVLMGNWWEVRLLALPAAYMEMISKKRIADIERNSLFAILY